MPTKTYLQGNVSTIYNMSDGIVLDKQAQAEGKWLYIRYNTDANIIKYLWFKLFKSKK